MRTVRVSVSQDNFMVGKLDENVVKIKDAIQKAVHEGSDMVIFPELSITGYPPEDLVFKPQFIDANLDSLFEIVQFSQGHNILIVVGFIDKVDDSVSNAAAVIYQGRVVDVYRKIYLPNYGVFDEERYFSPGNEIPVYLYRGCRIGVNICEDIWYPGGPLHYQALAGSAEIVVNISASPYHIGKQEYREKMFSTRAGDESVILVNCNLTGGQDELVFDGNSTAYNESGELIARMKAFEEDFLTLDLNADAVFRKRLKDIRRKQGKGHTSLSIEDAHLTVKVIDVEDEAPVRTEAINISVMTARLEKPLSLAESVYNALVMGTRDYINKNGFKSVVIAVSGGIDSALVAAVAVDALGKDRVKGVYMPSRFSADISGQDAGILASNLGIELLNIPIEGLFEGFTTALKPVFKSLPFNTAEENLQSRIRGNLIMALSNKFGWLVLTTGNKSEMSTGYATLYGDMAGGFAVIKDVLKTMVYELVHYRNSVGPVIPDRIITRPPTAELRENQKDSDSLPEYPVLDNIIRAYVEEDKTIPEIIRLIGDEAVVRKTARLIDLSEYKRRQSPPGVKISARAFGRDRRMPITNGYRAE